MRFWGEEGRGARFQSGGGGKRGGGSVNRALSLFFSAALPPSPPAFSPPPGSLTPAIIFCSCAMSTPAAPICAISCWRSAADGWYSDAGLVWLGPLTTNVLAAIEACTAVGVGRLRVR